MDIQYSERTQALQQEAMRYILWSLGHYEDVVRSGVKIIARGEGCYIYDADGRRYLDTFASLLTTIVGHHRPEVHAAMLEQMRQIEFYPIYHDCLTPVVIELAKRLAELAPGDLEVSFFVSDGSDATESAIKLARQYFWERGEKGRQKVLFRRNSYHGCSFGAMSATGLPWFREPQEPLNPGFVPVMAPHPYRCELGLDPEESARTALRNTAAVINWEGPHTIAAMILDPIPGSNVGYPVPPDFYLPELKALCDRHGILTIYDEIQVGMGKTGRMFCCEHWGVVPHFLCLAKGFTGGFAPMGAVLTTAEIADVFRRPGHEFRHGHTFAGHPVSAAATLAVLDILERENLVEHAAQMGEHLGERLQGLYRHPIVGDVRGKGLLMAVELVADRETRRPLDPALGVGGIVRDYCYRNGMIVRNNGDILVLAPPLTITADLLDEIVDTIEAGIVAAMGDLNLS
ncbi:MAG: aspartate aminotransferase family protein [Armatimonadetes bacterium]|nr:aspartate aminotransferase family protein [Armatimonadota bacterium]